MLWAWARGPASDPRAEGRGMSAWRCRTEGHSGVRGEQTRAEGGRRHTTRELSDACPAEPRILCPLPRTHRGQPTVWTGPGPLLSPSGHPRLAPPAEGTQVSHSGVSPRWLTQCHTTVQRGAAREEKNLPANPITGRAFPAPLESAELRKGQRVTHARNRGLTQVGQGRGERAGPGPGQGSHWRVKYPFPQGRGLTGGHTATVAAELRSGPRAGMPLSLANTQSCTPTPRLARGPRPR